MRKLMKEVVEFFKRDDWPSFFATLLLAFVLIRFVFFPLLSLVTGTSLPLVIVESCSMYHDRRGFDNVFKSTLYAENNISIEDTKDWTFPDGFSKGDVIFVVGPKNVKVGDVIIFEAGSRHPLIHRVIRAGETFSTKGDNYKTNYLQLPSEKEINKSQVIGKAVFRIPLIGWIKLIFFEPFRPPEQRGFCS
ncbi:hypothetical protein D6829_00955 [Candidatus Pacearchaeota archaeon]|nr:MAG: hypothetical protein D6829_00955 [Candidatus Pacearchaeota archaeon]